MQLLLDLNFKESYRDLPPLLLYVAKFVITDSLSYVIVNPFEFNLLHIGQK